jgi:predicted nucleic acid-binding protein
MTGTAEHADALLAGIEWGGGRPPMGCTSEAGRLAPDDNYDDVCHTLQDVADDRMDKTSAAEYLDCTRKTIDNALQRVKRKVLQHQRSRQVLDMVESGRWRLVWNQATRSETRAVLEKIPPLDADELLRAFELHPEYTGQIDLGTADVVEDPSDRKFAALAVAAQAMLISLDDHLLAKAGALTVQVLRPGAALDAANL